MVPPSAKVLKQNFRDHRRYMVHLLRTLAHAGRANPADIYEQVADRAGITAEERAVESTSGAGNPVYRNRIQFARQSLIDAKLMIGSADPGWRRGFWELNPAGRSLGRSRKTDDDLDRELRGLASAGARARAAARRDSRKLAGIEQDDADELDVEDDESPETEEAEQRESIRDLVDEANEVAMSTMLGHVRELGDRAFEHLVAQVLKASLRAESVRVTQKSRDGGFDGVLNFDDLGLRTAVFEAKRYAAGAAISRAQIDAFSTAARRQRSAHAIFVTSSHFSPEAIEAGKAEGVRLVEGAAFVELMARHNIGLRAREVFVLYEVDAAWSIEEVGD